MFSLLEGRVLSPLPFLVGVLVLVARCDVLGDGEDVWVGRYQGAHVVDRAVDCEDVFPVVLLVHRVRGVVLQGRGSKVGRVTGLVVLARGIMLVVVRLLNM